MMEEEKRCFLFFFVLFVGWLVEKKNKKNSASACVDINVCISVEVLKE